MSNLQIYYQSKLDFQSLEFPCRLSSGGNIQGFVHLQNQNF